MDKPSYIGTPTIGVFDSGVGGLAILSGLKELIPSAHYVYFCDQDFFPYGEKSEDDLSKRVAKVVEGMLKIEHLDILVIACNTASTLVLSHLRTQYSFPIVGVVPAIKTAAEKTRSKVIGILATQGTLARQYTHKLIDDFAKDCTIIKIAAPELVIAAEQKLYGVKPEEALLSRVFQPFIESENLDVAVLGCTHFSHLKPELTALYPQISWIDSTMSVARRVLDLISNKTFTLENKPNPVFYTTHKSPQKIPSLGKDFEIFHQKTLYPSQFELPRCRHYAPGEVNF